MGIKRRTKLNDNLRNSQSPESWLQKDGIFAKAFLFNKRIYKRR